MERFVLYGGKGGVGKTTCAAATGLKLANEGERTLLVSTDPAHSLGDVLETSLAGTPTKIETDLWGVEADPKQGQETYQNIVSELAAEFREAGISLTDEDIERLFAAGFIPGSDEVASLEYFLEYRTETEWDRIIFDTAPTGHTLRLLTLPNVLQESLTTAGKVRSEVRQLVNTARSMVLGPAAFWGRNQAEDELTAFRDQMEGIASLLRDQNQTDFRVVLTPETLAITETERLIGQLASYGIPVETLVVNRVVESVTDGCDRCDSQRTSQQQHIETIQQTFPEMEIQMLPDIGPEAAGRDALIQLGDRIAI